MVRLEGALGRVNYVGTGPQIILTQNEIPEYLSILPREQNGTERTEC